MPAQENRNHETAPAPGIVFMQPCSGVVAQSDGTYLFRMKALPSSSVTVSVGNEFPTAKTYEMKDADNNGIFLLHYTPESLCGPQKLVFKVNGQETLNPYAPLWFHANALSNYVELPDPETDSLIAARPEIPHGTIAQEYYYSQAYHEFRKSIVYVPPGYDPARKYPVLYFFHEVLENQTAWTDAGRLNFLLDNLIYEGKIVPFLVVENDCTVQLDYHDRPDWFEGYPELEQFLLHDCIPHMERAYSVINDKWARAISGIGLGAVQAGYIGLRNTDAIGNIGLFTAFWPSVGFHDSGKPDPFYTALEKIGQNPDVLNVFYRSEGDLDGHFKGIQEENEMICRLKADRVRNYITKIYHQSHSWGSYRRSFRDFAPLLFRE